MNQLIGYAVADPDFYAPLDTIGSRGELFRPSRVPEGWHRAESGVWTMWYREKVRAGTDGWKVHVSARPDRLSQVLDLAAEVCFEHGVPFKHLASQTFHHWTHHKHASRPQSGKFVAAYPADTAAARLLMERLSAALADEDGPYILTDRRFPGSRTVHYRYGAFTHQARVQADGTRLPLVRDGGGRLVEDQRGVRFQLPDGITDPFARPTAASRGTTSSAAAGPTAFNGFVFEEAIRHSNSGGTYRGTEQATGRTVFIKEARAHSGVVEDGVTAPERLRAEWRTLRALHEAAPGLAPEPLAYFRRWEHDFLVTEFVDGTIMNHWMAANHPMLTAGRTPADQAAYFARCERLVAGVEEALQRLHRCGYLFVDVSPGNVLVDEDDHVRLVDFEAAHRPGAAFTPLGTPGYAPPQALVADDLAVHDEYGLSALAQLLVGPFHQVVRRNPDALAHLRHDVTESGPVPDRLWARVTRFHRPGAGPQLPGPEEVAADPQTHLADLRDRIADGLLAMADAGHPARMFPTIAEGYQTNTLCLAYGAAGVVHALHRAGRPLPEGVLARLGREALAGADALAPGLYVGLAGIARVLADQGRLDEARALLDTADRHPLTESCATLYGGSAGVALAHLALYGHTRDEHHVDRALALAEALPPDDLLLPHLGADDATGLVHGRCGLALMLQQLAAVTGDPRHLARGVGLLHAELDRESFPDELGMTFPISVTDQRTLPYLYSGSAGMLHTVGRYLRVVEDERLSAARPRLLAALRTTFTVMPGLYQGLSGLGLALAEHADATGDPADRQDALRAGRGLFKYAVPHPSGVRILGDQLLRFSADLWSGSAGVLLFLTQLLAPRPDPLFTVDALSGVNAPSLVDALG
ncbi:class III lanthionine synthetase LanKC [Kitasatospora sp. MAP5-34]|uniref:class III lanthionine synthetase LanKC n=1 Tax=Kitasatospora sp. MAP5-34 TaxID=3035102 RepID=UPI0024769736|nr:class III lanthionine synthetase LanKC [Kitasatospora sp. MAP5-34]MDH6580168.1 hypothetical protein [Kitasatospora sp. MAP5-34]